MTEGGKHSFKIRETSDIGLILPIRWRNLYPGRPIDPESSREADKSRETVHFMAFDDGIPFGCVSLLKDSAHECKLRIRWLAVDENQRRKGIGRKLVKSCLRKARRCGIWCNVRQPAVKLYEKLGFVKVGDLFELPKIGPHFLMRHIP